MFQMINDAKPDAQDRKMLYWKIAAFVVALGVLGGVVYFFTFVSYSSH